jgi:hypothetical protein
MDTARLGDELVVHDGPDRLLGRAAGQRTWFGRMVDVSVVCGLVGGVWQDNAGAFWSALGLAILLASLPDPRSGSASWMLGNSR